MATQHQRSLARVMVAPSVILLLLWMIVPLAMTLWFSFQRYNLLMPGMEEFTGLENYRYFLTDPGFWTSLQNTLLLVGGVLLITVVGGIALAVLIDQPIFGQGWVRILIIAPFFVMPTVSALVWKNRFMNPVNGLLGQIARAFGAQPVDWLAEHPLLAIIIIVAWQWLPFATLILLTALQSLDSEQVEAAEMDGAGAWAKFRHITLPMLMPALMIVTVLNVLYGLRVFDIVYALTNGGPGYATEVLSTEIFKAFSKGQFGLGTAISSILFLILVAAGYFVIRLMERQPDSQ